MADSSFDIVSKLDRQEVDNALSQAAREIATRRLQLQRGEDGLPLGVRDVGALRRVRRLGGVRGRERGVGQPGVVLDRRARVHRAGGRGRIRARGVSVQRARYCSPSAP